MHILAWLRSTFADIISICNHNLAVQRMDGYLSILVSMMVLAAPHIKDNHLHLKLAPKDAAYMDIVVESALSVMREDTDPQPVHIGSMESLGAHDLDDVSADDPSHAHELSDLRIDIAKVKAGVQLEHHGY